MEMLYAISSHLHCYAVSCNNPFYNSVRHCVTLCRVSWDGVCYIIVIIRLNSNYFCGHVDFVIYSKEL